MTQAETVIGITVGVLAIIGGIAHLVVIGYRVVHTLQLTVVGLQDLTQQFVKHIGLHDDKEYLTRKDVRQMATKKDLEDLAERVDRLADFVQHLVALKPGIIPAPRSREEANQ